MLEDVKKKGFVDIWEECVMWGVMCMSFCDIVDVIGSIYIYLMNGWIL